MTHSLKTLTCLKCGKELQEDKAREHPVCDPCLSATKESRRAARHAQIESLMVEAGVPPKFLELSKKYPLPGWMSEYICGARGLVLIGGVGSTKTTTVSRFIRSTLEKMADDGGLSKKLENPFRWIDFADFIMQVQDAFGNGGGEGSAYKTLKRIASEPRLVIDDMGVEKNTPYVLQATYYLIDHREKWCLPTYITTNMTMNELRLGYGARIVDRLAGDCDVKNLRGESKRVNR